MVCVAQVQKVSEEMLILLGDMMAVLASNDSIRKLILYQKLSDEQKEYTFP